MSADSTLKVQAGALGSLSMRYHELALQLWLNHLFYVREGYPVPVVFSSPMDAFGMFTRLWSEANNPFQYLLNAKNEQGAPLYEPFPSPPRYPVMSVFRKGFKYRSYQNFSIHRFRHINWPSVNADVQRSDLGSVMTSQMPMAWDYRYQIDHFCMRPDTQAMFIEKMMQEVYRTGGVPQTWILCNYPVWGQQLIRVYMDGDIENTTKEEPDDGAHTEFRTTVNVVVEGFSVDLNLKALPALWELVTGTSSVDPETLAHVFTPETSSDLRVLAANPTMALRANIPGDAQFQASAKISGL